MEKTIESMNI